MRIVDNLGEADVVSIEELEVFMARRDHKLGGKQNEFWIGEAPNGERLYVTVNGSFAFMVSFPEHGHPGHHSVGNVPGLDPDGNTEFMTGNEPNVRMSNSVVTQLEVAVQVAKEFCFSEGRPTCIDWGSY